MVSTRQMTITTAPGTAEESFDTAASTSNVSRPLPVPIASASSSTIARIGGGCGGVVTTTTAMQSNVIETNSKQRIFLLDLPLELMDKIFSYVGYKHVAQLRLVSTKMNQISSNILNSRFQKLQTQTYNHFQNVKKTMPKRESARRIHPSASECDLVETCYMRLSLLEMTFGKHIDKKHICFFPGAILDEVYCILYLIKTTPKLGRPYKITEELFDLSTMAMEYFKEKLEPNLPAIAYFSKDFLDFTCTKTSTRKSSHSSSMPSPPQSNMVLRKGIRKIKQGMKKYNNQLTVLRNDLRFCKRKSTEQTKQIAEMQKLISEQQKQILEYAARLDENDKKNEEISMKISSLLQEANKCKTELQYWRSKSPAVLLSNSYGHNLNVSQQDVSVFLQQQQQQISLNGENINLIPDFESVNEVQNNQICIDLSINSDNDGIVHQSDNLLLLNTTDINNSQLVDTSTTIPQVPYELVPVQMQTTMTNTTTLQNTMKSIDSLSNETSVISSVGSPKFGKRKHTEMEQLTNKTATSTTASTVINKVVGSTVPNNNGGDVKKARKVQSKARCPSTSTSCKTRSK